MKHFSSETLLAYGICCSDTAWPEMNSLIGSIVCILQVLRTPDEMQKMTLEMIVKGQKKGCWLRDPKTLIETIPGYVLTENEAKQAVANLKNAIADEREGAIINWAVLGFVRGGALFLDQVRRQGVFRLSGLGYRHSRLTSAIRDIVKEVEINQLVVAAEVKVYLQTVQHLHTMCEERIFLLVNRMKDRMFKYSPSLLKSALMMIEMTFLLADIYGHPTNKHRPSDDPYFFSPEELAEGFSLALSLAIEERGEHSIVNGPIDTRAVLKYDEPMKLLRAGALVRFFRDTEVSVDAYGFTIKREGNRFVICPPSDGFLRAMRYGFMRSKLQWLAHMTNMFDEKILPLRAFAEKLAEQTGDAFVYRKKNPERLTFRVEAFDELTKVLNAKEIYREEYMMWTYVARELLTDVKQVVEFEVTDGVTIFDVLRVQRFMHFLRCYTAPYLLAEMPQRPEVCIQSLVPHYTKEQLVGYLSQIIEKEKVIKLIELLSYKPGKDKVFDVQYQPFVKTTEGYLIGTTLVAVTNMSRNLLQHTQKRLFHEGTNDPLKKMARNALSKRADYVHSKDLNYQVGTRKSDVDVLALWGGILFVFECKNALLPASPHELRNSYEHILKANAQLNLFRTGFADEYFRKDVAKKIGHDLPAETNLVTSIIMSNRMFLGLKTGYNTVTSVFELVSFLEKGNIIAGNEEKFFWKGKPTPEEFCRFLDGDYTIKPQWAAMQPYDEVYNFGSFQAIMPSFWLDFEKVAENYGLEKAKEFFRKQKEMYEAEVEEKMAELQKSEAVKIVAKLLETQD